MESPGPVEAADSGSVLAKAGELNAVQADNSSRLRVPCPHGEQAAPDSEDGEAAGREKSSPEEASSSGRSIPGASHSLDSLDSFSNLLSCPSSELLSDGGPEDRLPCAGPDEEDGREAGTERYPGQSVYHIKWMGWKEQSTPIVTQNENGPCPLLAIMNVLLLAWKVQRRASCHRPY